MEKKDLLFRKTAFFLALTLIGMILAGVWFYRLQERKMHTAIEGQLQAIALLKSAQITEWRKNRPHEALSEMEKDTALYSLLGKWPIPSRTAEVLLVRRDGSDVLFLNELRHQKGAALTLRIPLSRTDVPAVRAVLGKKGVYVGTDYRNVPVISATQPVPDSPWFIVAKEDLEEAFADWRFESRLLLSIFFGLVLVMTGIWLLLWQRNKLDRLQEIASAEAKFKTLFDAMNEGVCLHELVSDKSGKPTDYRILDVNPAFTRHTGISVRDCIGKLATQLYRSPQAPYLETYAAVATTGKPTSFDTYFPPLKKHFLISVFQPAQNQFATVFSDITKSKEAERSIAEEKERLAVTLRSIGDGVITTDMSGNVVLMNPVAEKLTGWTSAEARGRFLPLVFNIVNEFTKQPCVNPVDRVLKEGIVVELANHTMLISKTGREYIIADSGAPIRDTDGNIIGVVLVFHDTTEKQRLMENIQRSQKLESIGLLAGGIAHDFNNLLAGIFGYMDIALKGLDGNDTTRAQNALAKSLGIFDRARGLTRQLLTFSKGGAPIRRVQSIEPLLRHSTQFALSGSNVSPSFAIEPGLWPCDIDESQIEQVIDNLLINAKQAMQDGGRIRIDAVNVRLEKDANPLLPGGGDFVKITFSDTGAGIDKEILPRIFDPFFTTKTQGHGLGLATVHSILQKHGGGITVESAPGAGACFTCYLPASREPAARSSRETPSAKPAGRRGAVLVMDDQDYLLDVAVSQLSGLGYSVISARNGEEAVARFRDAQNSKTPFSAVILDLTIPGGMGGKETALQIRELDQKIPIIASSGYADNPVLASPGDFGFSAGLCKPYREDELTDLLAKLLA